MRTLPFPLWQFLVFALIAVTTPIASAQTEPMDNCNQFGHGTRCSSSANSEVPNSLSLAWNIKIGNGRSQVVGSEKEIFVTSSIGDDDGDKTLATMTTQRIDVATGNPTWTHNISSKLHSSQETFQSEEATPQATPALTATKLITVSFTGELICLSRNDGKLQWQRNLVADLGARPIQYGFASSPYIDPADQSRVYVLAGGETGGLFCLNILDGTVVWKSPCESSSYATPVPAEFCGVKQLVVETKNEVFGISKTDGTQLWNYEFAQKGQTNAATPLAIDQSRLLISGNGCNGTRCLSITETNGQWQINENWHIPNLKFIYTNWTRLPSGIVVGCTDKFLAAINVNDGTILGRWRGYYHGNVTAAGQALFALGGRGKLTVFDSENATTEGIFINGEYDVLAARCWVPISVVGNRIFIRGDDQLTCLKSDSSSDPLQNTLRSSKLLTLDQKNSPTARVASAERD